MTLSNSTPLLRLLFIGIYAVYCSSTALSQTCVVQGGGGVSTTDWGNDYVPTPYDKPITIKLAWHFGQYVSVSKQLHSMLTMVLMGRDGVYHPMSRNDW